MKRCRVPHDEPELVWLAARGSDIYPHHWYLNGIATTPAWGRGGKRYASGDHQASSLDSRTLRGGGTGE